MVCRGFPRCAVSAETAFGGAGSPSPLTSLSRKPIPQQEFGSRIVGHLLTLQVVVRGVKCIPRQVKFLDGSLSHSHVKADEVHERGEDGTGGGGRAAGDAHASGHSRFEHMPGVLDLNVDVVGGVRG